MVYLRGVQVDVLPARAALDAVAEGLPAGDHVAVEDPVQRDAPAAQADDLITHLQHSRKTNAVVTHTLGNK